MQIPLAPAQSQSPPAKATASLRTVVYLNRQYGFRFYLPKSWAGYTILEEDWTPQAGAIVRIRHPRWTEESPREDIPIMIFTQQQWRDIQSEKLIVSAAPFPPSELGHNQKYVFALPPRWNYDLLDGWEEAQKILDGKALVAF
jgi:hypothetical protein